MNHMPLQEPHITESTSQTDFSATRSASYVNKSEAKIPNGLSTIPTKNFDPRQYRIIMPIHKLNYALINGGYIF